MNVYTACVFVAAATSTGDLGVENDATLGGFRVLCCVSMSQCDVKGYMTDR